MALRRCPIIARVASSRARPRTGPARLRPLRPILQKVRHLGVNERWHTLHRARRHSVPNRVGLAAGLDKNAIAVDGLARLGFGFIEVGTVTPKPQPGQPSPRLFRLRRSAALINRMGFPNDGAAAIAQRLAVHRHRRRAAIPIGVNIGKNATTPLGHAVDDYVTCVRVLHDVADYFVVNVSSPNTPGLRELQEPQRLEPILTALLEERVRLAQRTTPPRARPLPLLVKISPDLDEAGLDETGELMRRLGVDGVIATNSTLQREGPALDRRDRAIDEPGGLSGAPLRERALEAVRRMRQALGRGPLLIGVGGIHSADAAQAMRAAGADLVQLYTGFILRGPALVRECVEVLAADA